MKLPAGFLASGVRSGVRKKNGADLALIVAPKGADAAAIFTKNRFQAAPVVLSRAALKKSGGRVRGVVVNAGCANAITGVPGTRAAERVRDRAAEVLGCPPSEIFLASTGVIGQVLPDDKVRAALPGAYARLSTLGLEGASHAILTTDVGPKVAQASFKVGGKRARIVGFGKGAGMIHPNMATMLAFLMTDAAVSPAVLKAALLAAADESFHAISVDGDTSTNDTVLALASGALGNERLETGDELADFQRALTDVCRQLAWMIVRDGEGATRVLDVEVTGAANQREAALAVHAVITSPLVKTAVHGGDPNWGRVLAAVGRSGARLAPRRIGLKIGSLSLVENGVPVVYKERDAARLFGKERIPLVVDLGVGTARARRMACDFGHDYVTLNADYRS
jgi:glutamate N-acetyltransferase/amino-acid N-acetyltransferase